MNRPSDQEGWRHDATCAMPRNRIAAEVHAVSPRRERHVEAIVDQHARARAVNGVDTRSNETRERTAVEITLPHLDEIDARAGRGANALDRGAFPAGAEASPIGNQAQNRTQLLLSVAAERERSHLGVAAEHERHDLGET